MLIVGIAGGTGSGKTTVVRRIVDLLPEGEVIVVPQDSYYRDSSHVPAERRQEINFDHPDSIEFELLVEHIKQLKRGISVEQPIYSYLTCTRAKETVTIEPRHIVIVEGILIFTCKELRDLMDIKIFVDADADDRLSRVIARDIAERGRSVDKVLDRYEGVVKPMHLQFIEPTKRYADIIIPQGGNNQVAINIMKIFIEKSLHDYRVK
ncbi:uridine kinase [Alistipes sp. ZOR0009]|jgi:uridine kinase|uniref:uridine kinase n=1 Tax=Alistipes sp. ZOR0009 TaxID=1339253 RepID=UPI00064710EE|nr:uridine kinase [Alistipes sp. ZOR0009]